MPNFTQPLKVGWENNMNKEKIFQILILLIILISMVAIVVVSRQLISEENGSSYQPVHKSFKTKAAAKTYSRLLALNTNPTPSEIPTAVISPSPIFSPTLPPEESPTPTEIILAKNNLSGTETPLPSNNFYQTSPSPTLPESGSYQGAVFLVGLATLIIFLSFVF